MRIQRPIQVLAGAAGLVVVVAACSGAGGSGGPGAGASAGTAPSAANAASASAPGSTSAASPAIASPAPSAAAGSAATPSAARSAAPSAAAAPLPTLVPIASIGPFAFPAGLVATADAVWVVNHDDGTVARIDPKTNTVTDRVAVSTGNANSLMTVDGMLWANDQESGRVVELDPKTRKVVGSVKASGDGAWVVAGDGAIWTLGPDPTLVKVDPKTRRIVATYAADPGCADSLAVGGGWVWTGSADGAVCRIDPATGKVVARGSGLGLPGAGIAWDGTHVIVPGSDGGLVVVDPLTLTAAASIPPPAPGTFGGMTMSLGSPAGNIAIAPTKGGAWVQYNGATIGDVAFDGGASPWVLYAGLPPSVDGGVGVLEALGSLWIANPNDAPGSAGSGSVSRVALPTR